MAIRRVVHELEAKLTGSGGGFFSKPGGKLERKSYQGGGERLKITLRNLKTGDGALAMVEADGIELAQVQVDGGQGRWDQESESADTLPALQEGQQIQVRIEGVLVLSGRLMLD